jgi:hypothetical protein
MILICLLIYIIGFFVTHWVIGPTHDGVENDDAQRALALLWPITGFILIAALPVFIVRQMRDIWNPIKSIFVNDAHSIISERGKEILAEQQKEYTFIPNPKTTRTQSDMVDIVIGVNGKRRRVETDYNKIFNTKEK